METATKPQIKASELRIGNWVKRGENLHQVLPMDFIYLYGDEDTEFGAIYSPILLSPEILEKCGFKYYNSIVLGERWMIEGKICIQPKRGCFWFLSNNGRIKLEYLHQLQNLYYCLTGEELPVSL